MKRIAALFLVLMIAGSVAFADGVNYSAIASEDWLPGSWVLAMRSPTKSAPLGDSFEWPNEDLQVYSDLSGALKIVNLSKGYVSCVDLYVSPDGESLLIWWNNEYFVYNRG